MVELRKSVYDRMPKVSIPADYPVAYSYYE